MKKTIAIAAVLAHLLAPAAFARGRIQGADVKSYSDITAAVGTATGNLSLSGSCISSLSFSVGAYSYLGAGQYVYDTTTPGNLSSSTTIVAVPGTCAAGQVQITPAANANATGDTLTFGGQQSDAIPVSKLWDDGNGQPLATTLAAVTGSGGGGGINLISKYDPGFESSSVGSNWTVTGGTIVNTSSTPLYQTQSGLFTPSSSGNTLESTAVAVQPGLSPNGGAYCMTSTSATDLTMQVVDTTASVTLGTVAVPTGLSTPLTLVFPQAPAGDNIQLQFVSASAGGALKLDNCYLGDAYGSLLQSVSQAQLVGGIVITGCSAEFAVVSPGQTSYGPMTGNSTSGFPTGCTYTPFGAASAPGSSNIPAVSFSSLPPGEYRLEYEGSAGCRSTGGICFFQFTDGTNVAREQSTLNGGSSDGSSAGISQSIAYTAAQNNVTLQIYAKTDGTSGEIPYIFGGASSRPGVIKVYRLPSAAQLAVQPNTQPGSWSGALTGSCDWTTGSTTFADPSVGGTCSLVQRSNVNFGSVTQSGTLPAIVFTPQSIGAYYVCATSALNTSGNTTAAQLIDNASNVLGTASTVPGGSGANMFTICGVENVSSLSPVTLKLQIKINSGTTGYLGFSNSGTDSVTWSIVNISQSLPNPYIVGQVSSATSGQERVERVSIGGSGSMASPGACSSSPCTIYQQSGSWISSVTRNSTGNYTLNFNAGEFSGIPACTCSTNSSYGQCTYGAGGVISSGQMGIATFTSSGSITDTSFNVICMGAH